ncbi:uncharacterized protein LOC143363197 [Halictus rubicundus]|uniref:uncharacterized protein LOC143363197 n=1 Tax=Halictus rubicundus TaxID=77578 RepID=UPI004036D3F2
MKKVIRKQARENTLQKWQEEWDDATVGRWTHRLIPDIEKWINRKHGQLNFYITQALTGHGVFNNFRKRIGKTASDECWYHHGVPDTPDHTLVACLRWEEERKPLVEALKTRPENLTIEIIIEGILAEEKTWIIFANFCKDILRKKEEEERKREKDLRDNLIMRDTEEDLESADAERMIEL